MSKRTSRLAPPAKSARKSKGSIAALSTLASATADFKRFAVDVPHLYHVKVVFDSDKLRGRFADPRAEAVGAVESFTDTMPELPGQFGILCEGRTWNVADFAFYLCPRSMLAGTKRAKMLRNLERFEAISKRAAGLPGVLYQSGPLMIGKVEGTRIEPYIGVSDAEAEGWEWTEFLHRHVPFRAVPVKGYGGAKMHTSFECVRVLWLGRGVGQASVEALKRFERGAVRYATIEGACPEGETKGGRARYLGLEMNRENRTVARDEFDGVAEFGKKEKAWRLFVAVFDAREKGTTRAELEAALLGASNKNNLDQWKRACSEILSQLNIEVNSDQRGLWRLTSF